MKQSLIVLSFLLVANAAQAQNNAPASAPKSLRYLDSMRAQVPVLPQPKRPFEEVVQKTSEENHYEDPTYQPNSQPKSKSNKKLHSVPWVNTPASGRQDYSGLLNDLYEILRCFVSR